MSVFDFGRDLGEHWYSSLTVGVPTFNASSGDGIDKDKLDTVVKEPQRRDGYYAVYPGTFDPVTNGHIDLIKRGAKIFPRLVVAVASNLEKNPFFSLDERVEMLREVTKDIPKVLVESFDGLLVDYVQSKHATVILRGIRVVSDLEYEFQMAFMNRSLNMDIETIFLMPHKDYLFLSSKAIKQVALLGGDLTNFVPSVVIDSFEDKLNNTSKKSSIS